MGLGLASEAVSRFSENSDDDKIIALQLSLLLGRAAVGLVAPHLLEKRENRSPERIQKVGDKTRVQRYKSTDRVITRVSSQRSRGLG